MVVGRATKTNPSVRKLNHLPRHRAILQLQVIYCHVGLSFGHGINHDDDVVNIEHLTTANNSS